MPWLKCSINSGRYTVTAWSKKTLWKGFTECKWIIVENRATIARFSSMNKKRWTSRRKSRTGYVYCLNYISRTK